MSAEDFQITYQDFIRKYPQDLNKGDTSRRSQAIIAMLKGLTTAEVAAELKIEHITIRQYRSRTFKDFEVKDFAALKQLFDRYPQIWNPEDGSETVTNIAKVETQFNNLPIRHCIQPIGRAGDIDRLLKSIPKYDVIWVRGIGGCGKTTTLLEVANCCLDGAEKFDAIIYISAQTEGIINNQRIALAAQRDIVDIYRQIFNTFDRGELMYANIASRGEELNYDHLNNYLCQLLQKYRTLLIFDNFDTQENYDALRQVIHRIPRSTRILVGSRQIFDSNYQTYDLKFLAALDAEKLIRYRLQKRKCKLTDGQIASIIKCAGGLPLAIEFIIGLVAIPDRDASDLEQFFQGNLYPGDLLEYCLGKAIKQLQKSQANLGDKLIKAIALFPDSAPRDALIELTKSNQMLTRFDRSIQQLFDLSLIMTVEIDRYTLHPVVRAYLNNILTSQPAITNHLRQSWMQWYHDKFVKEFDKYNWHDWQDYRSLEIEWDNLSAVINWCFNSSPYLYERSINFWNLLTGFTLVCGYWQERKQWLEWLITDAKLQDDRSTLALALYHLSFTMTCMDDTSSDARKIALEAWDLDVDFKDRLNLFVHIAALSIREQTQRSLNSAQAWLADADRLFDNLSTLDQSIVKYYQAEVEFSLKNLDLALSYYQSALSLAMANSHQKFMAYNQGKIALIKIEQGKLAEAETLLVNSLNKLIENKDARAIAFCHAYLAILKQKQGNYDAWVKWHTMAIESFQQLNMHQQAGEFAKMQFTEK